MKNKMKWLPVLLCLVLFAGMAIGSGSSSSSDGDKQISSVTTSSDSESKETDAGGTEAGAAEQAQEEKKEEASAVTIEEQVLYDDNDIKITATGIEDSWAGTKLTLLIENNSCNSFY